MITCIACGREVPEEFCSAGYCFDCLSDCYDAQADEKNNYDAMIDFVCSRSEGVGL